MAIRTVPLRLGLAQVNVKVESAIESDSGPKFHTVCTHPDDKKLTEPARVKQSLVCPECQNSDRSTFEKAADAGDGKVRVVTQQEQKDASEIDASLKDVIDLTPHPAKDVREGTIRTGKVYRLDPGKGVTPESYALFVGLVKSLKTEALCTMWAVRSKPAMYELTVHGDSLVLCELAWPDDVKPAPAINGKADKSMLDQIKQLVKLTKTDFDPSTYKDSRVDALSTLLAGKAEVSEIGSDTEESNTGTTAPSGSLADQLNAALESAKGA